MLTRTTKWSWLKAWAMKVAARRGIQKAIVALARRQRHGFPLDRKCNRLNANSPVMEERTRRRSLRFRVEAESCPSWDEGRSEFGACAVPRPSCTKDALKIVPLCSSD